MKRNKKIGALLLVLLMLAGMMTAVSAKVYTEKFDATSGFDTEEDFNSFVSSYVLRDKLAGTQLSYYDDGGNGAMRITYSDTVTSQGRLYMCFDQLEQGKSYAISFRAKDMDATSTSVWVYSEAFKPRTAIGGTSVNERDYDSSFAINNTDWTEYNGSFTYTGTTREQGNFFLVHKPGTAYDYLIDDVQIIEVNDAPLENKTQELVNAPLNSKAHYDLFRANEVTSLGGEVSLSYDSSEKAMKAEHTKDGQGRINSKITLEKGVNYNVSFKAKAAVEGGAPRISYYIVVGQPVILW